MRMFLMTMHRVAGFIRTNCFTQWGRARYTCGTAILERLQAQPIWEMSDDHFEPLSNGVR